MSDAVRLSDLLARDTMQIESWRGARAIPAGPLKKGTALWTVILRRGGYNAIARRQMTIVTTTDGGTPDLATVLGTLIRVARAVDRASGIREWCEMTRFPPGADERDAYHEATLTMRKLHRFLSVDYDAWVHEASDDLPGDKEGGT